MMPFPSATLPFGVNLWLAARLLTFFSKGRPLDEMLRRATPGPGTRAYAELPPAYIVAAVKASVARPWRMRGRRCLREGLLAFYYLRLAGHKPVLHFGLVPRTISTPRPRAHCWISLNGQTVLNPPQEPMLDLFSYDGDRSLPAASALKLVGMDHD
jgi:hypothetical protein